MRIDKQCTVTVSVEEIIQLIRDQIDDSIPDEAVVSANGTTGATLKHVVIRWVSIEDENGEPPPAATELG